MCMEQADALTSIESMQAAQQSEVQQFVVRQGGPAARVAELEYRLQVCAVSLSLPVGALGVQPVWSQYWILHMLSALWVGAGGAGGVAG